MKIKNRKTNIWLTNLWKRINALSGPVSNRSRKISYDVIRPTLSSSLYVVPSFSGLIDIFSSTRRHRFYSHLKTIFFLWLTVSTYMQSFGLLQKQLFGLHYIIIGFFCSVHFVLSNEILWPTVSSCLVYFVLSCTLYMQYFRWVSSRFVCTVHCTVSSSIQILQPPQCLLVRSIAFFPVQCNLANVGSLTRTRTCNLANVQLQVHTTVLYM